jgi:serpin B
MKRYLLSLGVLLFACGKPATHSQVTDAVVQSDATPPMVPAAPPPAQSPPPPDPRERSVPFAAATPADRAAAIRGNQAFASRLYAKLRTKKGNLFFSPASLRVALAMTYAGARGKTATEMRKVLALEGDDASIHTGFAALLRAFEDVASRRVGGEQLDPEAARFKEARQVVHVVNQLWGQEGRAFTPSFQTLLESHYASPLGRVDFLRAPDTARTAIDTFVYDHTAHAITDILPAGSVTTGTRLVLTNVASFSGKWSLFDNSPTTSGPFHVSPSSDVPAALMSTGGYFKYARAGDVQWIEIKYASPYPPASTGVDWASENVAMIVALPESASVLEKLEESMGETSLDTWIAALSRYDRDGYRKEAYDYVHLTLPRFRMTRDYELSNVLSEMGMREAFDRERADLSGMDGTKGELSLSAVVHGAFVDVDGRGAAAEANVGGFLSLTGGTVAGRAPPPVQRVFRADHPFLFLFYDLTSKAVLFMGRVMNPNE